MSLILEALRKSEAQRRLGQAPDLHSPVIATGSRGRLPRWLVPAVVLMLVGAAAWWLGRMAVPDPSNGTATEAIVSQTPLPLEGEPGPPPSAPPGAEAQGVSVPAPSPAPRQPAPAATVPAASPPTAPAPAPAPSPAPVAPAPPSVAVAPPAPEPEPAAAMEAPVPVPAPATAPDPSPPVAESDEGLLRLADLPAATRANLPELRISMHVYAEQPSRRFAIIDGRRVGEGGLLEGQGVVEAIRRDGIVVDFDGRRVLLPRP